MSLKEKENKKKPLFFSEQAKKKSNDDAFGNSSARNKNFELITFHEKGNFLIEKLYQQSLRIALTIRFCSIAEIWKLFNLTIPLR